MHRSSKKTVDKFAINRVLAALTASDSFVWGSYAAISTFAGLYLAQKLELDPIRTVAIGVGLSNIISAILQMPIGYFVDKHKSDKDEIFLLFLGSFLMGIIFILFPFMRSEYAYYFLMIIFGTGVALNLNTWRKLFATNVEKDHEGLGYGLYQTVISIVNAFFILIGGMVASISSHYFDLMIVFFGGLIIFGGFLGGSIIFVKERNSDQQSKVPEVLTD